jgi:hypothetical protein
MRYKFWLHSVSRFSRVPAIAVLSVTLLGACSSSNSASKSDAAAATEATAETSADSTETGTPAVSIVEVEPEPGTETETQTAETVVAASPGPNDDPNAANPNFPVQATASIEQSVAACTPLAEAYQQTAATWLAVKLIAESNLAVGKSFNPDEITQVQENLATLRKGVASDPAATKSVDTMERGFGLIIDTSAGKTDAGDKLSEFVKATADLGAVPKPIGAALRKQGCIVVDY